MLNRRFQVLFDKDLWNKIVKTAKSQNISVGGYIRKAVIGDLEKQKQIANNDNPMPFKRFFKPGSK